MSLEEQLKRTKEEYDAYKNAQFACPEIIEWLAAILQSLVTLKRIRDEQSNNNNRSIG